MSCFFFFLQIYFAFLKYLRIHRKTERPWFIVGLVALIFFFFFFFFGNIFIR